MGLDHVNGEQLDGMDPVYRVVPVAKYADMPKLTTIVKRQSTGKFKRMVEKELPIFQVAMDHAREAFINAGAPPGKLGFDMICQEYPRQDVVTFLFNATIDGVEHYAIAPFKLGHDQIADLTVRNLWQPFTVN